MSLQYFLKSLSNKKALLILPLLLSVAGYAAAETCPNQADMKTGWKPVGTFPSIKYQYNKGDYYSTTTYDFPQSNAVPMAVSVSPSNDKLKLDVCIYSEGTNSVNLKRNPDSPLTIGAGMWSPNANGGYACAMAGGSVLSCQFTVNASTQAQQNTASPFGSTQKP